MEHLIKSRDKSTWLIKWVARCVPQDNFFEAITFAWKETEKVVRVSPHIQDLSMSKSVFPQLSTDGETQLPTQGCQGHGFLAATPESHRIPKL